MRKQMARVGLVLAVSLSGAVLAGCGDDDDGTVTSSGGGKNTVKVEMKDYSYAVSGSLTEGMATIASENTGDEMHMMILAKLKAGVTVSEMQKGLAEQFSGPPGGGGEGGGGEEEGDSTSTTEGALSSPELQLIAQTSTTTGTEGEVTTQTQEEGGEEEGEDPFTKYFEEDETSDAYGHVLQPGRSQAITTDVLTEGTYAMICFIPTAEEGVPHAAKGMIGTVEVEAGTSEAEAPEADATYMLTDGEAPEGPDTLKSGEVTIEVKSDGTDQANELIGLLPKDGEDFASVDEYFTEIFEGEEPPAKDYMDDFPGTIFFDSFVIPKGKSVFITADLEEGEYELVNGTDPQDDESDTDYQVTKVKVS